MTTPHHPPSTATDEDESATPSSQEPLGRRSKAHPLAAQCPAKSKRTGQRCKRRVIGGGVCAMHGGRAPQVAAAREARILAGEAALAVGAEDRAAPRTAGEALTAAAADADVILQRLKRQVRAGEAIDGAMLQALGDWLDRSARLSKVVLDAGVNERLVELEQDKARMVAVAITEAMDAVDMAPADRETFTRTLLARMRVQDAAPAAVAGELL